MIEMLIGKIALELSKDEVDVSFYGSEFKVTILDERVSIFYSYASNAIKAIWLDQYEITDMYNKESRLDQESKMLNKLRKVCHDLLSDTIEDL